MRLSKTTNHAIKILIDCAHSQNELVKVAEISERLDITPQNVFKIVHLLSRAGFLSAVRGRHGGVRLSMPADDIKVGEVIRAIEETATAAQHPSGIDGPRFDTLIDTALEAFIEVLNNHTIADMAKSARSERPGATTRKAQPAKSKPAKPLPAAAAARQPKTTRSRQPASRSAQPGARR